ncbi:alcohol dehydrogenase [Rhizodiscina lignyota]|uniref:Alcohol dehydrogenase n=1 Tax=Rhizodiscina lignyota TaxID=1504668 RepID=A0A9P4M441_9PEZI|nr:alcohol dehydrogenase [Rhizodiscina lignyota]
MPETMQAWAVVEHEKPLQKIERPIPEPKGTEVLVKVTHCGICHSDLHFWHGYYELGGGKRYYLKERGAKLPHALGHEILGTVAKLGPDADNIPLGASRIVYPWTGCQKCRRCQEGDDNLCLAQQSRGIHVDGGFAQYVLVPHAKYLVDHEGIDPAIACTFGCSGLTVLSSIQKLMPIHPQDPILLIGAGGLGLAGIAMLRALGHEKIISADISPEKLQTALDAGATAVVNSADGDAVKAVIDAAGEPVFGVLDFVNNGPTAELGFASMAKGGKMVAVGILGGRLDLSLVSMIFRSLTLQGNITGALRHLEEVTKLAKEGKFTPAHFTEVPWDEASDALMRLKDGKVTGRLILVH